MDNFFSRIGPAYKSVANKVQAYAQPAATGWLSGLLGSLTGRVTPAYKTVDGQSARAPASSGFWSMFFASPSYKTARVESFEPIDADTSLDCDAGDPGVDESGACVDGQDLIVVL